MMPSRLMSVDVVVGIDSDLSIFFSCRRILRIGFFLTSVMSMSASIRILIFILLMLATSWTTAGVIGDLGTLAGGWLFYGDSLGVGLGLRSRSLLGFF